MKNGHQLESMIFFPNGNYCAFWNGAQVPEEQGSAWIGILQNKLDRGVIGPKTKVTMAGWANGDSESWTVEELLKSEHLKKHKIGKR